MTENEDFFQLFCQIPRKLYDTMKEESETQTIEKFVFSPKHSLVE